MESEKFTPAEKVALRYSELMGSAPEKIDATLYKQLKQHYSAEEIVELGVYIGFNVGYHTFFGTLDFYPMFTPDGRLVDQDESRRVYGDKVTSHLRGAMQRTANSADDAARE